MSQDTERIPVPTNGRGTMPDDVPRDRRRRPDATPDIDAAAGQAVPRDQTVAFTPNQLAVGFGIVAGLVLLVAGARRRRGGSGGSGRDE